MAKNTILSTVIREIKYQYGITQKQIVSACGLKSNTYLSDLINGKSELSELFIDKLVSTYPINKEYLISGNGEIWSDGRTTSKTDNDNGDDVTMSREVFNMMNRLTETVLSQQRTIESMQKEKMKKNAQMEGPVISADAK